jgi:hypothetical protein
MSATTIVMTALKKEDIMDNITQAKASTKEFSFSKAARMVFAALMEAMNGVKNTPNATSELMVPGSLGVMRGPADERYTRLPLWYFKAIRLLEKEVDQHLLDRGFFNCSVVAELAKMGVVVTIKELRAKGLPFGTVSIELSFGRLSYKLQRTVGAGVAPKKRKPIPATPINHLAGAILTPGA